MNEAVMRSQGYAISMEHDMSRVFGCERFGFAGIINSDFIRRNPLAAILATCGFVYARGDDSSKKQVEKLTDKKSKALVKQISSKPKVSIEKKPTTVVSTKHEKTAKDKSVYKPVIVPQCNDFSVSKVLSDAFKQQGDATKTSMMVKQIFQARETQFYPQKGIRSCHALVVTDGKSYQTDYSVILNDKGFFIQVENAQ